MAAATPTRTNTPAQPPMAPLSPEQIDQFFRMIQQEQQKQGTGRDDSSAATQPFQAESMATRVHLAPDDGRSFESNGAEAPQPPPRSGRRRPNATEVQKGGLAP